MTACAERKGDAAATGRVCRLCGGVAEPLPLPRLPMRRGCVQMDMRAGVAYAVVVDGFNGQFGPYQIDITADQVRAPQ